MPQEQPADSGGIKGALRGLLTAAGTVGGFGAGAGLGAGVGVLSSQRTVNRGRRAMLHGDSSPIDAPQIHGRGGYTRRVLRDALAKGARSRALHGLLGAALGAGAGGIGAYQLLKRKKTAMNPTSKADLLAALKGIGGATAGGAGIGGLVGAGIGAVSGKPEDRSRLVQILRMALKGGAIGGGATAGALTGGLGAGVAAKGIGEGAGMSRGTTAKLTGGATLGGALAGGGAGGALGAKLGAEKRAVLAYILRGHLKQALLQDITAAVRGR